MADLTGPPASEVTPDLFTIGHSNHTLAHLLDVLDTHKIEEIADVRRYPRSRRQRHFDSEALARALEEAGIGYRHWPDLGGFRDPSPGSRNLGLEEPSLRAYADHMGTPEFDAALDLLLSAAVHRRTAVLCAEADPEDCHRLLLSDAAVLRGARVHHILDAGPTRSHRTVPPARVENGRLIYPETAPRLEGI